MGQNLHHLHDHRRRFSTADADRGKASLQSAILQRVNQRDENPRAARHDRMTKGDGAAVDVEFVVGDARVLHRCECDDGKRFVDFEEIDVVDLHLRALEHQLDRFDRCGGEPLGLLRVR